MGSLIKILKHNVRDIKVIKLYSESLIYIELAKAMKKK